jgi:hypothetical protein
MEAAMVQNTVTKERSRILVSVEDKYLDQLPSVAEKLREQGMTVEAILELVGTIVGSIHPQKLDQICKIKGVSHVELDRGFQLPPTESDVQ